ncbi:MAG: 3-hydroxyisobutyrate dehydrogenase [Mycobacteriaceae bacterium]
MRKIGFIGLGHMGLPMAANLVEAGYLVLGFDLSPQAISSAKQVKVPVASSATEAVKEADVVITMLPKGEHVIGIYQELCGVVRPGTLFVDCSTVDVADARTAHDQAVTSGHRAADAPVSGGVAGSTAGTLTFMVGADKEVFGDLEPILSAMGKKIVHCGPSGAGQAAKICNNMILGISMIAVSEAFVLGEKLGLSNQALYDVASTASGQCWALTSNCPVPGPLPSSPANRDYTPGFAVSLMAKDLGLAANAVSAQGVSAELGLTAARIYDEFNAEDGANLDFSAIITSIRAHSERAE